MNAQQIAQTVVTAAKTHLAAMSVHVPRATFWTGEIKPAWVGTKCLLSRNIQILAADVHDCVLYDNRYSEVLRKLSLLPILIILM